MPVKVRCGDCEEVLTLPDRARGKTVRCPHCEAPVKVPPAKSRSSPGRARKAAAAADDSEDEDFLADLDLDRLEDRRARVCPRCGADVPEDEFECPRCFVDIRTGKITEKRRRKLERKGPDPSEFYQTAWSDGWRFVQKNYMLAVRTFLYLALFLVPGFALLLLAIYFHQLPLKIFFSFLTLVANLAAPGWVWYLWLEVINATAQKKSKLKRVPFDFFLNVSLGLRVIGWQVVFGLPILLIPAGVGGLLIANGNALAGGIVIGLGYLLVLPLVPLAMAHMTMPVTWPGWVSPYCVRTFFKHPGPLLYWTLFSLIALLPFIATSTAGGFLARTDTEDVMNTVRVNAAIASAKTELAGIAAAEKGQATSLTDPRKPLNVPHVERLADIVFAPSAERVVDPEWREILRKAVADAREGRRPALGDKVSPREFPFPKLILPGVFLVLNCAALAAGIVFCMRMNGLLVHYFKRDLDLITMTREKKYVSKEQKLDEAGQPIKTSEVNVGKWVAGVGGLILFYAIANVIVYFASGGEYIILPRPVAQALNLIK
ncbi:MAG TPA: hypothetical protein VML55_08470 [Planctomycetaceae bacterium]|nr:hypothetical protein [Planctomycetaceae bacterium]